MKKWLILASAVCATSMSLVGCGGGGTSSGSAYDRLPAPTIRIFNLVPDNTAGLSVAVDDSVIASNIAFRGGTADFQSINDTFETDGATDISVNDVATAAELDRINDEFLNDSDSLIVMFGKQNYGDEDEKALQILRIPISRRPVAGKARLLILNGYIPSVGRDPRQINFQTANPADPLSSLKPLFQTNNINFGKFEGNSVLDIDAGTRLMQARDSDSDSVVVVASKTFTFVAGKIYLAIVSGQEDAADPARRAQIDFVELTTR
ncbi:MAG: DUF4397 domain-containing protein [Chthonomonas sp.]|nr:DUF4397 domain-containing protein [Chthonomonas sp.]